MAFTASSLDKKAQNVAVDYPPAEDYSTNVAVDFPRNQIFVVESPREKWQNAAVNYPSEKRRFWNQKIGGINEALNYATKKVEQNVVVDYHTKHLQIRPKQLEPGPRQV